MRSLLGGKGWQEVGDVLKDPRVMLMPTGLPGVPGMTYKEMSMAKPSRVSSFMESPSKEIQCLLCLRGVLLILSVLPEPHKPQLSL